MKKLLILSLSFVLLIGGLFFTDSSNKAAAASGSKTFTVEQGGKWKVRIDFPTDANPKYHGHVYNPKGKQVGVENLDGSKSHGDSWADVPSKVKKKIKEHKEYKKYKEKQEKLDKAAKQIKSKKLNLKKTADIIIAIGIVVAATATWFFPGDDVAAWGNLLRALA